MVTRRTKLILIFFAFLIAITLHVAYMNTADGRLIFSQFPGFFVSYSMCKMTCVGVDNVIANGTWVLISFIQYYAILRLFAAWYVRLKK